MTELSQFSKIQTIVVRESDGAGDTETIDATAGQTVLEGGVGAGAAITVDGISGRVGEWIDLEKGRVLVRADGTVDFDTLGEFDSLDHGEFAEIEIRYETGNALDGKLNYELYDGVPAGYTIHNIPTTGTQHSGTVDNFDVNGLARLETGSTDTYMVRYTGVLRLDEAGEYDFKVGGDDGAAIFINGELVSSMDGLHAFRSATGSTELDAGYHDIEIRFFENYGRAGLKAEISGPSTDGALQSIFDFVGTERPDLGENLIINGDFEDHGELTRGRDNWDVFDEITGWTTPVGQLEIQAGTHSGTPFNAADNSVVELDSHDSPDANAGIQQVVDVQEAGTYLLSFDYSPRQRGNEIGETSVVNVIVNGEVIATISADVLGYEKHTFMLDLGAGANEIGFSAAGTSDTFGPLLDNVSLVQELSDTNSVTVRVVGETDINAEDDLVVVKESESAGDIEILENGATSIRSNDNTENEIINLNEALGDAVSMSQSSQWGHYTADYANDGKLDTRAFNHTHRGADEWVEMDLGGAHDLDHVVVYNRSDAVGGRLNGAEVVILDENRNELVRYDPITDAETGSEHTYDLSTLDEARFVRIEHSGQYLHVNEIQVFGSNANVAEDYSGHVAFVNGEEGSVGQWVKLEKGRIKINDDGTVDFDAWGEFDHLDEGQSETVDVSYTVGRTSGDNLITNGDFEDISGGTGVGSTPEGWDTSGAQSGVFKSYSRVDNWGYALGGWSRETGQTLEQTIKTVAGQSYELSFGAGRYSHIGTGELTVIAESASGQEEVLVTLDVNELMHNTSTAFTTHFKADDAATKIRFEFNGDAIEFGDIDIDNVSVLKFDSVDANVSIKVEGEADRAAVDDKVVVSESETGGDTETLENGAETVLENDIRVAEVVEVNGQSGQVGEWIELEKGRVKLNADGTLDFDADGDFEALDDGESETVSLTYTAAQRSGQNLVQNGDFEDLRGGYGPHHTPLGWEKSGHNSGVFRSSSRVDNNGYALGGWSHATGQTLSQVIDTKVGQLYELTFDAGRWSHIGDAELQIVVDGDSGPRVLEALTLEDLPYHGQATTTLRFEAEDAQTRLSFVYEGDGHEHGDIDLDNISLYEFSPVEATVEIEVRGETDPDAINDAITVSESEADGDLEKMDDGGQSVADNDIAADTVVQVNGAEGAVGEWIELEKGRVKLNADGTIDFDADGDFESLNAGESETITLTYGIDAYHSTGELIVNGGFEEYPSELTRTGAHGDKWDNFDGIPGWSAPMGFMEIQDGTHGNTPFNPVGNAVAEVNVNTPVAQTVTVTEAGEYTLSFDYAPRFRDASADPKTLKVMVDGEVIDTFRSEVKEYSTKELSFFLEPGEHEIAFSSVEIDNGYGPLLDNVSLVGQIRETATVEITVEGETDYSATADVINVTEEETSGDFETLESGANSILENDVNGEAVVSVNGVAGNVGEWIDLAQGRVMINADGTIDFDADGDFEALDNGEVESLEIVYGIGDNFTENLIVNGTFETYPGELDRFGGHGNKWDVFDEIEGWTTPQGLLEIQQGKHGGTPDNPGYNSVVELDSHDNADTNAGITQLVEIAEGGEYTLTFDYSPRMRGNLTAETSILNVVVNGETLLTVSSDVLGYESYEVSFDLEAGQNVIGFGGAGVDDTFGPLIDNVELVGKIAETSTVTVNVEGITDYGSVSGTYFVDENGNAVQDAADGFTRGQIAVLLNEDGTVALNNDSDIIRAFVDGTTGAYTLGAVEAGNYRVGFTIDDGLQFVTQGDDLDRDGRSDNPDASDVNPDLPVTTVGIGREDLFVFTTDTFEVGNGEAVTDVDAGVALANLAPVAEDDAALPLFSADLSDRNAPDSFPGFINVLDNDSDPDGDDIQIIRAGSDTDVDADGWFDWQDASDGGQLRINESGEFAFRDLAGDFIDLEDGVIVQTGIEYEITDGRGGYDTAIATFVIEGGEFSGPGGGGPDGNPFGPDGDPFGDPSGTPDPSGQPDEDPFGAAPGGLDDLFG